jgi:hypothetical protein
LLILNQNLGNSRLGELLLWLPGLQDALHGDDNPEIPDDRATSKLHNNYFSTCF